MKKSKPKFEPLDPNDGACRPYALNMDWLQLLCWRDAHFVANGTNSWGYTTVKLDHGSKYWAEIYDCFDPEGTLIGQLACAPHKKEVSPNSCMFKVDNSILYEESPMDVVFSALQGLMLTYKGVARIDIAYDCNELYNGLAVPSLIWRYLQRDYIKCGQNKVYMYLDMAYHADDSTGQLTLWNKNPRPSKGEVEKQKRTREEMVEACRAAGIEPTEDEPLHQFEAVPEFRVGSVTWGLRSQAVQVQIYDKSRELREVKMKQHILHAWKEAGLDITKPVYRIEIRITNRGKQLKNLETGRYFTLSVNELLMQEQLEQLFYDYAEKYLKFYHREEGQRIQRCQRLPILSLHNRIVNRPKPCTLSKDYTRSATIALHELDRLIVANSQHGNEITGVLRTARDYMSEVYDLRLAEQRWMAKDMAVARLADGSLESISPNEYFEQRLKGAPHDLAEKAAKARAFVEQKLRDIAHQREEERQQRLQEHLRWGGTLESFQRQEAEPEFDTIGADYTQFCMLLPTRERPDFDAWAQQAREARAKLIKRLEDVPPPTMPYGEITNEEREKFLRQMADYNFRHAELSTDEILSVVDDCPF